MSNPDMPPPTISDRIEGLIQELMEPGDPRAEGVYLGYELGRIHAEAKHAEERALMLFGGTTREESGP